MAEPYSALIGPFEVLHAYPAHIEETGFWVEHGPDFVSSGPFVLTDWDDDSAIFSPNPHYYNKKAVDLEKIEVRSPDQMAAVSDYIAGHADLLMGPLGSQRDWLISQFRSEMAPHGGSRQFMALVNAQSSLMADQNVRHALSLAINRHSIGEGLFGNTHQIPVGIMPEGVSGYSMDPNIVNPQPETFDERLALARKLMAEAGYNAENRLIIRMMYASEVYGYREIVNFLEASWKDIFVDLEVTAEKRYWDSVDRYKEENFDLIQQSITSNMVIDYITFFIENSDLYSIDLNNDPEIAELVSNARRAFDGKAVVAALEALDAAVTQQFAIIPIITNRSVILTKDYVDFSYDDNSSLRFGKLRLILEKFPDSRH